RSHRRGPISTGPRGDGETEGHCRCGNVGAAQNHKGALWPCSTATVLTLRLAGRTVLSGPPRSVVVADISKVRGGEVYAPHPSTAEVGKPETCAGQLGLHESG